MGIWQASGFQLYSLSFKLMGTSSAKDAFGNPIPSEGATVVLKAYLKASSIRSSESPGIDLKTLELSGRLDDPKEFPANLAWESEAALTLGGVPGVFRLRQPAPSPIPLVDEQLGAKIVGIWRAT